MSDLLEKLIARTGGARPRGNSELGRWMKQRGVAKSVELQRILALPRRPLDFCTYTSTMKSTSSISTDSVADQTPVYRRPPPASHRGCELCRKGEPRLWPLQSRILLEAAHARGALGPMPVGAGKTLVSLLLPAALKSRRAVLLVPAQVRDQLLSKDIGRYSAHFAVPVDRIRVLSYSELSTAAGARALETERPDLIVCDEAHNLRHKTSARTKRFLRYLREAPECAVVALSGTMTTRSVRDYAHLSEVALRKGSPLPKSYGDLLEWSAALDVGHPEPLAPGALLEFCTDEELAACNGEVQSAARVGFRRRLLETPGVVASSHAEVGATLRIQKRDVKVPAVVSAALAELRLTWRVGDEEIEEAARLAQVARQLACGFYYVWDWPGGVPDREWLSARAAWNKSVREFLLRRARPGVDSPLLLSNAIAAGKYPELRKEWEDWQREKVKPAPPVVPVWLDGFLVDEALRWIQEVREKGERGIVWFAHRALEERLRWAMRTDTPEGFEKAARYELARVETGGAPRAWACEVFGAGEDALVTSLDPKVHDVVALSIKAHGTGKNLQGWSRGFVLCPPANGQATEQLLGRQHRPGQEADEVVFDFVAHTEEVRAAIEASTEQARYVEDTQGARQKLLYAERVGL